MTFKHTIPIKKRCCEKSTEILRVDTELCNFPY